MRPASERFANIHLHTIPYPRNLEARKGAELGNSIWELFGGVFVFQIRQQGRHRRFQRRQILLGELPTMSHAKRRRGKLTHCGKLRPFSRQVGDIAGLRLFSNV